MNSHKLKFVGVINENPFDPQTWSGSSKFFFDALKKQGVLHKAISAQPSNSMLWFCKLLSFHPKIQKWRFKYNINVHFFQKMTKAARHKLNQIDPSHYQVILQVGAWYDLTGYRNKPVVSYHDGNLATLIASPYGYPRIRNSIIRRTLTYERDLYKKINLIFPMSKWLAKSFVKDFGIPKEKAIPVGAGINLPKIREVKNKSYDTPRILFIGKAFKRKGGDVLLDAFKLVRKEIKNAELIIIGPDLKSLSEGIYCKGFVSKNNEGLENLLDEYQNASLFVMPSLYEPFGIVFAEAMAHRLPCIGSDICAMPEIIQHGKTGYVVPPGDPIALSKSILTLLKDPAKCKEFGDAGYLHYKENFTWQKVCQKISEIVGSQFKL